MNGDILRESKVVSVEEYEEAKKFWYDKLTGEIEGASLSYDFLRTSEYDGKEYAFCFSKELSGKLIRAGKNRDTSLFVILLTALKVLIYKYTNQETIVVSSPPYDLEEEMNSDNIFIPLCSTLEGSMSFKDLLMGVMNTVSDSYQNQFYPIKKVFSILERDLLSTSIFKMILSLENIHKNYIINDYLLTYKSDIAVSLCKKDEQIKGKIVYNAKIFIDNTIKSFIDRYVYALEQLLSNSSIKIEDVTLLMEDEKERLLIKNNNTFFKYQNNKTIHELFGEIVNKIPDCDAVVYNNYKLTYLELDKKSNQLARLLRTKGVGRGSIVGLMMDRSHNIIISILAILKAGGAYLPIDPELPVERIKFMINDSKILTLITQDDLHQKASFKGLVINISNSEISKFNFSNLDNENSPDDLAYIIYTSGSTGRPKGVMVKHKGVSNLKTFFQEYFSITEDDRIALFATISFDASVSEMFMSLLTGATLHILSYEVVSNYKLFEDYLNENCVTVITLPPHYLSNLNPEKFSLLRVLISAGSASTYKIVNNWGDRLQYINAYGPTETTVCATCWKASGRIDSRIPVPIGKPIFNTQVYILDKNLKLQPEGIVGEICICGEGLAVGYLNLGELSSEKFVHNPFKPGELMYRTGDLGRWLPDGNIEFLGRMDNQIKVRGYRIEIGEIETQILSNQLISEVVVATDEDSDGEKYLTAYFVSANDIPTSKIREYLSEKLPNYMIPDRFVQVDKISLTPSGKADVNALKITYSQMIQDISIENHVNWVEEKLVELWRDILGHKNIGTKNNFFDIGGNSLKATIIVSRVYKEFNIEVPLKVFFDTPTIKHIAEYINNSKKSTYYEIRRIHNNEFYHVSSVQKRIFSICQFENVNISYNLPLILRIEGGLRVDNIERIFKALIQRHESFRTSFILVDGEPMQKIHENVEFSVTYLEKEEGQVDSAIKQFIKPFNLEQAPLMRAAIVKVAKDTHVLICDMHHIISDEVSMNILIKEFANLYIGYDLKDTRIDYKDYAYWQNDFYKTDIFGVQEKYWQEKFANGVPRLNIPTDFERPPVQSFEGDRVYFALDNEASGLLKQLVVKTEATQFMVFLAAYNILLYKYTGQDDILVASPISSRPHPDLENVIGMFVNMVAIRNTLKLEKSFIEFLDEVKANALSAYENGDYPLERLVSKLGIQRDPSRNPLFDTVLTVQSMVYTDVDIKGLKVFPYRYENMVSKFDLHLLVSDEHDGIHMSFEYATKLLKRSRIEKMSERFLEIIKQIIHNPKIKISDINIAQDFLTAEAGAFYSNSEGFDFNI